MENTPCFRGWSVVRRIGCGQFGAVYEIQKESDSAFGADAEVEHSAMKVISVPPDGELDALREECDDEDTVTTELRNRLNNITNEFKLMSHLQGHSNIVSYQDHEIIQRDGELGWDVLIRMELLTSLSVYTKGSAMDEAEVIRLGLDMCRALARCEKHNILHRDIKPQNIFVNKDGDFKLGDFGVARFSEHMTASTVAGTYDYMAPEVYSYLFNKASYDKRVDIYSLGLVLYWLLNERRGPFLPLPPEPLGGDKRAEATQRRMSGELLPRPAHGSQGLQDIVLKACAFKPEDRYQSAEEFYNALNAQRQAQGAEAIPIPVQKLGSTEETEESSESDNGSAPVNESAFAQEEAERGKTLSAFNGTVYAFADDTDFQKAEKPQKRKKLLPVCIAAACAVVLAVCVIGYFNCWLGHTWDEGSVTVAATHTAVGTKTYACSVCGDTREESVDKLTVHTYDQQDVDAKYLKSEATCTEAAVYYYSCACGEKGTDTFLYGEPNGHSWDNGAVTTVATHMSTGIETYTCSVCGETKEETIAKLAEHTYDQENADVKYLKSAATCTEAAVYYYSCECGQKGTKTFTSGSANGHQWDSGTVTKAATHTSTGTKRFTCKACGGTREETVAKLTTHTYDQKVTSSKYLKSAATCTEAAVYYYSCKCGQKGTGTFHSGSANGHNWKAATYTTPKTCKTCGATTGNVKGYRASVDGEWSSERQSFSGYTLSYLIFSDKLTNCTKMTVNVNVSKDYGPAYETWILWARIDGWFQNIKEFTLSGGEGSATITVKFDEPTTLDAITISPKSRGSAIQWGHSLTVTDIYCRD